MAVCTSCGKKGILLRLTEDGLCKECEKQQYDVAVADYNKLVEAYSGINLFRKHIDQGNLEGVSECIALCENFDACAHSVRITPAFSKTFLSHINERITGIELPDFGGRYISGEDAKDVNQIMSELIDTTRARKDMMVDFATRAEHF